jgi:hypothetical protein
LSIFVAGYQNGTPFPGNSDKYPVCKDLAVDGVAKYTLAAAAIARHYMAPNTFTIVDREHGFHLITS